MTATAQTSLWPGWKSTRTYYEFDRWAHTPGGRMVMRDLYEIAAAYWPDYRERGITVSMFLVIGLERHRIKRGRAHAQKGDVILGKSYGYTLNNSYAPHIARQMVERRPEWNGMFELRELKGLP
jgi:hypothetical protein